MPKKGNPPPYPKKPHSSGQARIKLDGHTHYLGVWGTPESHAKYAQRIGEWLAGTLPADSSPARPDALPLNVAQVVATFLAHCRDTRRRKNGDPKSEVASFERAVVPLLSIHGSLPIAALTPRRLEEVRDAMPALGWSRGYANRHLVRIRTLIRWAEKEGYAPANAYQTLRTVPGLTPEQAVTLEEVPPVPEDDLAATIPHLGPVVRDLVQLQLLTGARPSEAMGLRPQDLQRFGQVEVERGVWIDAEAVWVARLKEHKNAWRGQKRYLLFGPRAQAVLTPYLDRAAGAFLFSPREAGIAWMDVAGRDAAAWAGKRRPPRDHYDTDSYRHAVERACDRADAELRAEAKKQGLQMEDGQRLVERWTPARLRHNAATRLTSEFGPEVARIILGQRDLGILRRYVQDDVSKAAAALAKVG